MSDWRSRMGWVGRTAGVVPIALLLLAGLPIGTRAAEQAFGVRLEIRAQVRVEPAHGTDHGSAPPVVQGTLPPDRTVEVLPPPGVVAKTDPPDVYPGVTVLVQ